MTAELSAAFAERDWYRLEAAAVWLRSTGTPLVELYEVLLDAALEEIPEFPTEPAHRVRAYEVQERLRDVMARLAPRQRGTRRRGTVLSIVPGGSRWVLGHAALTLVLEDAGYDVIASRDLALADVVPVLAELDNPVGLCLALHDPELVPPARDVVRAVRAQYPEVRVVVGGLADRPPADLAGLVGAHSTTRSLRETLHALSDGANPLSPREMAVLTCVARGMSNPDAGEHLGVAPATVKTHLDRVFAKLGTSDRTASVALAMRRGWLD